MVLEGTAAGLQTSSYRAISAYAWRHGLSGSLWEGNATALGPVLYRRIVQDRQQRLLSHVGGQLRASDVAHPSTSCVARGATTVRPRGIGRRRTFNTPNCVGLHSLQTWPDGLQHLAGRGLRASSGAFFIESCSQSSHCPCICCGRGVQCS